MSAKPALISVPAPTPPQAPAAGCLCSRKGRAGLFLLLVLVPLCGRLLPAAAAPSAAGTPSAPALPAKAPLPTVLLYPATPGDVAALVDLRTRLRLDGHVQVLTYDSESAAIQRASAENAHPDWLISAPATDEGRMILARALGAAFYAVVSPGRAADSTHVELVETAPAARTFAWTGSNRQFGVRAIESQVADSITHPASYASVASSNSPAPVPAPSVVVPVPSVVVPVPAPAPIVITLPQAVPTVEAAPLPLLQTAPVPLKLPVQIAQGVPVPYIPPPAKVAVVPLPKVTPPAVSVTPAAALPKKEIKVALLPKPALSLPALSPPTPSLPLPPIPPVRMPKAALTAAVRKPGPKAEDMTAIQPLLTRGDSALESGDAVSAIALYRQAINGAPLSIGPRLKLAQAYQKDGLSDRALDEARRALEIAPDNLPVQQFLSDLDQQTGTSTGTLIRDRAALERAPDDPAAHTSLADTLWNNGDLGGAEAEYKAAQALAPVGDHAADAHLAQLYAAEARYTDCLAVLRTAGNGGYALAIQIVKNRAETLGSTLSASRDTFAAGKSTREQFYDDAKKLSAEAQALAGFVAQVAPPTEYSLSHLHRMLSTNLLAQEAATLVSFIETGDSRQNDSISQLEKAAATEMLTAQAAEEKRGLWKEKP